MLSAFPPVFCSDSFIGNPFPSFEQGFPTWESVEPLVLDTPPSPNPEPAAFTPQEPNRDANEPGHVDCKTLTSGSEETGRLGPAFDERKRRRMLSNRDSARRSRMRKQRHLENLRNQVSRLKARNRELVNLLRLALHDTQAVVSENESLRSEAVLLRQRLCDIRQILHVRQLQQHLNPSSFAAAVVSKWPYINTAAPVPLTMDSYCTTILNKITHN